MLTKTESQFLFLDGSHIEIQPPKEHATDYYNYKGWYSIVLLACVDYKYRFMYINVGATGRNNDSYIYEGSLLKKEMEGSALFQENQKLISGVSVPIFLLGDSAFKMSCRLIKPYPYSLELNEHQISFNRQLSRARRVVENVFGHLKARFRKIGKGFETTIPNARRIIKACCVLHNICNEYNDPIDQRWLQDYETSQSNAREQPVSLITAGDNHIEANTIRTALTNFFHTNIF